MLSLNDAKRMFPNLIQKYLKALPINIDTDTNTTFAFTNKNAVAFITAQEVDQIKTSESIINLLSANKTDVILIDFMEVYESLGTMAWYNSRKKYEELCQSHNYTKVDISDCSATCELYGMYQPRFLY